MEFSLKMWRISARDVVAEIAEDDMSWILARGIAVDAYARAFPIAHAQGEGMADGAEIAAVEAYGELVQVVAAIDGNTQVDGVFLEGAEQLRLVVVLEIEIALTVLQAYACTHELFAHAEQTGVVALVHLRDINADGGLALIANGLLRQHVAAVLHCGSREDMEGKTSLS